MSRFSDEDIDLAFEFWCRTRIDGMSASMADLGEPVSRSLLRVFDDVVGMYKQKKRFEGYSSCEILKD